MHLWGMSFYPFGISSFKTVTVSHICATVRGCKGWAAPPDAHACPFYVSGSQEPAAKEIQKKKDGKVRYNMKRLHELPPNDQSLALLPWT